MMGMEMMLGKMIGLTPDQMKAKASEFEAMIKGASDALISIAKNQEELAANQAAILSRLGELDNGR
jgi:sensor histidine kinase regulating citrate/malate metabolism